MKYLTIILFLISNLSAQWTDDANTIARWVSGYGITTATGVSAWQSTVNNHTLVQTTGDNQPSISNDTISFDNTNDYMEILAANASAFNLTTTWTIELWIKCDAVGDNYFFYKLLGSGNFNGFAFQYYTTSNRVRVFTSNGTGGAGWSESNLSISLEDAFHHVAVTFDNGTYVIYVDNTNRGTGSKQVPVATSVDVRVARDQGTNVSGNQIKEMRISNIARTPTEITAYYNYLVTSAGIAPAESTQDKGFKEHSKFKRFKGLK